tara:strand:- start:1068 stop:2897 length:1830 start_codon:yes stop_codon:yes gene_type:complete
MPKIPTFTATGRPTTEVGSVRSNIQIPLTQTIGTALAPVTKAVTDYAIKQKEISQKLEANKIFFEIQDEVNLIQDELKNDFDEDNSVNNFNQRFKAISDTKLNSISNKGVKSLLQNKLDLEYPEFVSKVKTNSRNALEKQIKFDHDTTQNILSSEYIFANSKQKTIILDKAINNEIAYANDVALSDVEKQENINKVKQSYLISDVNNLIENKQYGAANAILKNVKNSTFLDVEERKTLLDKVKKGFEDDLSESQIRELIVKGGASEAVGLELETVNGTKITKKVISSGLNKLLFEKNEDNSATFTTPQIIQLSINRNAEVPSYKESLIAGTANMTDTGNKEKILQGYELYKLFEVQNADETLIKTYKISQSDIESYQRLDYSINVLGETFDSALNREIRTRAGNFKEKNIDDKKIDSRINELDFKGRGLFDFGEPNVNNIQAVENILKYTANMYFKAGGSEDTALDAAEKFLEKNFRIDTFGQVVRVDSRQPEWHDQAVKEYIKNLYDEGKINKETNDLDDIIPQYYDYAKFNIQGFTLINKKTGEPLTMQSGDFDEEIYGTARFTQEQIENIIYKPIKEKEYPEFLVEFERRKKIKQEAENFGLGIYD